MKHKIFLALAVLASAVVFYFYFNKPSEQTVTVVCETTKGSFEIQVRPAWSPKAAERFLEMVDDGFYQDIPLFRCVENFICQFGATVSNANAKVYSAISDDAKFKGSQVFEPGFMSFAGNGPNSRTHHVFITLGSNVTSLGQNSWETPFAQVTQDSFFKTVKRFTTSYGDMPPWGNGPDPQKISKADGANYLKTHFPKLDFIKFCQRRL